VNDPLKELVDSISSGDCVAYIGSGVSAAAGYPTWETLLKTLVEQVRQRHLLSDTALAEVEHSLVRERFPEVAEYLNLVQHQKLSELVCDVFRTRRGMDDGTRGESGSRVRPTAIHYALTRIPFSLAITPNYDDLLEVAYTTSDIPPRVEHARDFESSAIRTLNQGFYIFRTHGELNHSDTLILTAAHFRGMIHGNPRFRQFLKALLMTKTFFFVGTSLRDPDLMSAIEELAADYGHIRKHYALLPTREAPELRSESLSRSLGIEVIRYEWDESGSHAESAARQTRAVASVLTDISAMVAKRRVRSEDTSHRNEGLFSRRTALARFVRRACEATGAFRGDICLLTDDLNLDLTYTHQTEERQQNVGDRVSFHSVVGKTFYQAGLDGILVEDTEALRKGSKNCDPELRTAVEQLEQRYGKFNYKVCHPDTMSEVAVPILANGQRFGVLNLESSQSAGFNKVHQGVAQTLAMKAGIIVSTAERRRAATEFLGGVTEDDLLEFFSRHPYLRPLVTPDGGARLETRLLRADYVEGVLRDRDQRFECPFDAKDDWRDATFLRVLVEEQSLLVTNVRQAASHGRSSPSCQRQLGIDDELFGVPLLRNGLAAGVLACWNKSDPPPAIEQGEYVEHQSFFRSPVRGAINRVANLAASSIKHDKTAALRFLDELAVAHQRQSVEGMLGAFVGFEKSAQRVRLLTISGSDEFSHKKATLEYECDSTGRCTRSTDGPTIDSHDQYFTYIYWRSMVRFHASRTPPRFATPSGVGLRRALDQGWYSAPVVAPAARVINSVVGPAGRVLFEEIHPGVKDVVGIVEVDSDLAQPRTQLGAERQADRERLCWALNVLTNLLVDSLRTAETVVGA
jgi:hypothetical protein